MRLFVYPTLSDSARALLLQQLPPDVVSTLRQDLPPEQQQASFQQAEVLLGNPPVEWFQSPPTGLQFWQIDSAGIDRYRDVQVHCPVANVGDFFAWPCAETMLAGLLAVYRCIPQLAVWQTQKHWVGAPVRQQTGLLRNKRVIILGSGAIGQAVAQQLSSFTSNVQFLARTDPKAQLHAKEELQAALPETDIVVNCLPGSAEGFFSAELIEAMTPTSIYASVGRGNTTDEPALIAALQAGRLGGAVLDVTAQEPLPTDSPLWSMPNVLLTQHSGGGQPEEDEGKVRILLRNLHNLQNQQPLENQVELRRGY